jgi:hypothetical protein
VPYQLAQYWDKGLREQYLLNQSRRYHHNHHAHHQHHNHHHGTAAAAARPMSGAGGAEGMGVGHVPRDLRATAKRTPAVKAWLRVLEEPVREWVVERGLAVVAPAPPAPTGVGAHEGDEEAGDETDPDDEEIVFVGRNGRMRDGKPWKKAQRVVPGSGNGGGALK